MRSLAKFIAVILGTSAFLAGCRPLAPAVAVTDVPPGRLLLVDDTRTPTDHLQVRPVDPTTLADRPGYAPLSLGHHYASAISPDGRTLAAFIWPAGDPGSGGTLHLIDLATWTETLPGLTIHGDAGAFGFTPDGQSLEWVRPTSHTAEHNLPQGFLLERYDLAQRRLQVVARFPLAFDPTEIRRLPSGNLAVYGTPTDAENLAADAPHVLLVDPHLQKVTADVRLDGVKAWQYAEKDSSGSMTGYRMYWPGLAWDLARERLYVADAARDHVVVVDLAEGSILRQADLQPRASVLDRLVAWLVPTAAAKGEPTTRRQALLSPDGDRLYLDGSREGEEWASSGIDVVDTSDLSLIRHLDLPADGIELLPGGQRLAIHLFWPAHDGQAARQEISVRDAARLHEIGAVGMDTAFQLAGCSADGRFAYVGRQVQRPDATWESRLEVLQAATGRVVASRSFGVVPSGYLALVPTTPNASDSCLWD